MRSAMQPSQQHDQELSLTPKRAYVTPELVDYGNVREITRGAGTAALDADLMTRRTGLL